MEPVHTLLATQPIASPEGVLPEDLRARYGGDLFFPLAPEGRPYCIANFVSTLDGVVSFNLPGQSGGDQISHANEEDRFTMGLLRASVDAILVGSGTLHGFRNRSIRRRKGGTRNTGPRYSENRSILLS